MDENAKLAYIARHLHTIYWQLKNANNPDYTPDARVEYTKLALELSTELYNDIAKELSTKAEQLHDAAVEAKARANVATML